MSLVVGVARAKGNDDDENRNRSCKPANQDHEAGSSVLCKAEVHIRTCAYRHRASGSSMSLNLPDSNPVAETRQGAVVGRRSDGHVVYKGVPYAQPPVGLRRFRPPEPVTAWDAPRDAGAFGAVPVQPQNPQMAVPGPMSEDCLTLNVWAPSTPGPHPVLFWVYGGLNTIGASSQPIYDGASFARKGVVFISANYRLGVFGFLELGTLEPELAGSSLNGLRDLTAALGWVQENIAAFGGDPGRVTLMGESAGAKNVCALATLPAARGLFARLAVQSGGGHTVYRSADEAAPVTAAVLAAAKVNGVAALTALPADALLAAQNAVVASWPHGFVIRPTVDGNFMPHAPIDAARAGATAPFELVIGTCHEESARFMPPTQAEGPFRSQQLAHLDLPTMQTLTPSYAALMPEVPIARRNILQLTAEEYWIPSIRFAEAHTAAGGAVWMYRFDRPMSEGPLTGYAPHGSDLPFVFGAPMPEFNSGPLPDAELRRTHQMWARYAATGKVTVENATSWPRYGPEHRATMLLSQTCVVADDPGGEERALWSALF